MDAVIIGRIALETAIPESSVSAAVAFLQNGASGPFIARYRKEATGELDETKIRTIQDRLTHYREALELRADLLKTLEEQGALTDELKAKIEDCLSKPELEDMQRRFRPRKKTRALEAVEKGLQPLAEYFWKQEPDGRGIDERLDVFVDPARGVLNREQALQGVVDILAEWIWEKAEHRRILREMLWGEGRLVSAVVPAKVGQKTKYNMYYDRREPVSSVPSHRVLAIRRGCKEGVLVSSIEGDNAKAIEYLLSSVLKNKDDRETEFFAVIEVAVKESYSRMLRPMIETEVRTQLKERADREAIKVFQENLTSLLLAPPAGHVTVMGADIGKGRECSLAIVDGSGRFLEGAKIRLAGKSTASAAAVETAVEDEAAVPDIAGSDESAQNTVETPKNYDAATDHVVEPSETAADADVAAAADSVDTAVSADDAVVAGNVAESPETDAAGSVDTAVASEQVAEPSEHATVTATVESVVENAPLNTLAAMLSGLSSPPAMTVKTQSRAEKNVDLRVVIKDLIARHKVQAIAIGAGTGARDLENLLRQVLVEEGLTDVFIAAVNDAGLAIYSSSRLAREEFPNHNASMRCAVSLALRLQDPLSEMVKLDPKLIGVGQYQHDVDQKELHRALAQTVHYCVNKVGVNLNEAGVSLLRYVSGLNDKLARRIVALRATHGTFASRAAMNDALMLDAAVYEYAAAFLRITDGENALDRTAIHPESYPIVEKMAGTAGVSVGELIGNRELVEAIDLNEYVTENMGLPTLTDIREELMRPGRDPRRTFKLPKFSADVKELSDLKPGMTLEGIVTNVTNFGAFVDVGVRQDGLVHLSQMSSRFIRDPREAVKVGDVVEVRVISVDSETKRIGLSMKTSGSSGAQHKRSRRPRRDGKNQPRGERTAGSRENLTSPTDSTRPANSTRPARPANSANSGIHAKEAGRRGETAFGRRDRSPHSGGRDGAPRREGKRPPRKPEQRPTEQFYATSLVAEAPVEPVYDGPEPSLEEKIAILQSKFRGIK